MRPIENKPLIYKEITDNSKHNNFSRQAYNFLKAKQRRLRKKMYEGKHDNRDNKKVDPTENSKCT